MQNLIKNVIMSGIFSVETPDTAGEVLDVHGADISDLQTGKATLNTEHINPDDAEKSEVPDEFKGFQSIVGRVVNAKKIFSDKDCENDLELRAWKEYKKPLIYGTVEIWDGPEATENARAAASIARMFSKSKEGPQLGLSVEGATVKREGNMLKHTIIKKMALTMKPANRSARIDIVKDEHAPQVSKSMSAKTTEGAYEPLRKSFAMSEMQFVLNPSEPILEGIEQVTMQLSSALQNLRKTLTAGGMNAAPGALTNGSALQKEHQGSQMAKLLKLLGNKPLSRDSIKKALPGISDKDAEVVEKAVKAKHFQKTMDLTSNLYQDMTGKKS